MQRVMATIDFVRCETSSSISLHRGHRYGELGISRMVTRSSLFRPILLIETMSQHGFWLIFSQMRNKPSDRWRHSVRRR
jgi:hypothetical protein